MRPSALRYGQYLLWTILLVTALAGGWGNAAPRALYSAVVQPERDCVASNNEDEVAQGFMSRCCRGSIDRKFPDEWRWKTIGEIKKAQKRDRNAKTAWKLLNECEYKKEGLMPGANE